MKDKIANKPDFFIVGAPKCGTTALYEYLRQHPEIFMPEGLKEPNYFNTDLHSAVWRRPTLDEYLALFAPASNQKRIGEASVWYLYSKVAAWEIRQFSQAARIIIMLRNPVDMIYSLHSELLFGLDESIADFRQALEAEEERKLKRIKPTGTLPVECLFYRDIGKYSKQVQQYYEMFGRDRVHIIIFDDLRKDPKTVYQNVLDFLNVAKDFQPAFTIVNPNKMIRSERLNRLLFYSPQYARRIVRIFLPEKVRWKIGSLMRQLNVKREKRSPMDRDLHKMLQLEFADDIKILSSLVGRDLSHWTQDSFAEK
ncbi:MAG: sulfotransferase domain-containing protein [Nitrospirae bacterium]|nr:sulfotransferase domain-containing protein [Nitrospirota bacterium]